MHNFGVMAQVLLIGENRFLSPCDFKEVRRCKTVTFDNFCAISLATALEHHSANQFLKAATNLNVVQPKLFQASRQDDLRFSDCTVSVIQILDDTDAAFRISGAELRTVLSATTMLADKPHRFNGRTSVQRVYVIFDTLRTHRLDPRWSSQRLLDSNPLVWMAEINGIIIDLRQMPREIQ